MRVTLKSLHASTLNNLNKLNSDLADINKQISSTFQMSKISDNPVNLVAALGMRSNLAELKQYQENLVYGRNIINNSESSLTQVKELLSRARLLTLQAVNASGNINTRANTAPEMANIFKQTIILANTQINEKYIFAGYRTTGYTKAEPAPFIEGYVDGYQINSNNFSTIPATLTGSVGSVQDLVGANDDLLINGADVGDVVLTGGLMNGLNMDGAANLSAAIHGNTFGAAVMAAKMTTLTTSTAATEAATSDGVIDFTLNGSAISVNVTNGDPAATVNNALVAAINAVTGTTGVTALIGDGTNGAALDTLILKNTRAGNDAAITIAGYTNTVTAAGTAVTLVNGAQGADGTHNTGEISLSGTESFALTTSAADDSILNLLGLGGGTKGPADEANDGQLVYGSRLGANELIINGIPIGAATTDGRSDIYADLSAEAKAIAINTLTDTTGVTADIVPVFRIGAGSVTTGTLNPGDLVINGVDIIAAPTAITDFDVDNVLVEAINGKSGQTGVVATRDEKGHLLLTTKDTPTAGGLGIGRNLHIQTTGNGETVTHLNTNGNTANDNVYFGSIRLRSENAMLLSTTPTATMNYEPGLVAIGLDGGQGSTGESGDIAGDGIISVVSLVKEEGNVRYAGDRRNNIDIKVGKTSTITVSKNGQDALMTSGVFETLKGLEHYLDGKDFTEAKGYYTATTTTNTLERLNEDIFDTDKQFKDGYFTITIKDKAYNPPRDFKMDIPVDIQHDTLQTIADKINNVPWLTSSWNSDGNMEIAVSDPDRYSIAVADWSSNFLGLMGINPETMQIQALEKSLASLDDVMTEVTRQVADFGARSNRIDVQEQIFSGLELAVSENLSEKQDTDIMKAAMDMRAKETAYQAALAAASRAMQMSLVDFMPV